MGEGGLSGELFCFSTDWGASEGRDGVRRSGKGLLVLGVWTLPEGSSSSDPDSQGF